MCVLSIKVSVRKKSGNLFNDHRIYIYIYIYIYIRKNIQMMLSKISFGIHCVIHMRNFNENFILTF